MTSLKSVAGYGVFLFLTGLAPMASATVLDVTGVGVDSWNSLNVAGQNLTATAIELTTTQLPKPLWVFCVDLAHSITAQSYDPPIPYKTGFVTTDSSGAQSGTGKGLSLTQSEEIQTLADLGSGLANAPSRDSERLTAIAGAIWEVEYNYTPSQVVGTTAENTLIADYITYAAAHPAADWSKAVYPVGPNGQGFGVSQGFATAVPEPGVWSMMILGAGLLGGALRRRRGLVRAPAAG